jgi:hypothetical protein
MHNTLNRFNRIYSSKAIGLTIDNTEIRISDNKGDIADLAEKVDAIIKI